MNKEIVNREDGRKIIFYTFENEPDVVHHKDTKAQSPYTEDKGSS